MKNLEEFRANQHIAPSWAMKKASYYRGIIQKATSALRQGSLEKLEGEASVIFDDPGQPLNQTVVWGDSITIAADKSYLIVDGVKIVLPSSQPRQCDGLAEDLASLVDGIMNVAPAVSSSSLGFFTPASRQHSGADMSLPPPGKRVTAFAIDNSRHPDGIQFSGITVCNQYNFESGRLEQQRSGTVIFKSGKSMPIQEYDKLSFADRTAINEMKRSSDQRPSF